MSKVIPQAIQLSDYQSPEFLIHQVHLHFDLNERQTRVTAIIEFERNPGFSEDGPLVLNGESMVLQRLVLDGKLLSCEDYTVSDHHLTIHHVPEKFTLESEVTIKPEENTQLSGLYKSRTNYCTQCESQGFRRITYFLDRPDVMTRYTTSIAADKTRYPMLLSNGNLIETKELDNNRHWVKWEDPSKKPSYLFALVAGDFDLLQDTFTTCSGRKVDLRLYLEKGFNDQGDFALKALQRSMKWDEEAFNREYDLDIYMIVAVSDFNMGAMENKGLNIFNTKYILANSQTATDNDYIGIENVIGHEYFHNWSGNRVTCRDWFQITLKEGLTVFRDQCFIQDMTSEAVMRINTVNFLRSVQFVEDAGPMAHPIRPRSYIEVNNFYTNTVYRKGAEVIRMVQTLIGKEAFKKAMDLYFSRYDGEAVTTEDFIQAMQDSSGLDLTQFLRWYDQAGTPVLDIRSDYNESAKTFLLTVKQMTPVTPGQDEKLPLFLPLSIGFVGSECCDMPTQLQSEKTAIEGTRILQIKKAEQTFEFINVSEKPVLSLLRKFSAPVRVNYDYTDEELLWLIQCDSDSFARWEAGQEFYRRVIFGAVEAIKNNQRINLDTRLVDIFRKVILSGMNDYWYMATLLTLPNLSYLMQFMQPVDIESLHQAYHSVKKQLSEQLVAELKNCYDQHKLSNYEYNAADIGKRAIKNLALAYLVATEEPKFLELAFAQFTKSTNMTDVMGALNALNQVDSPYRIEALEMFFQKWKQQPLLVNKWLMLQAQAMDSKTIAVVKHLLQHPAYDSKNPNNVYSLIVSFGANPVCFHAHDGAGYELLADQVLDLDPHNPQVAARVIQPLTRWKMMDKKRQQMIKAALQRILEAPKLSNDVYEIVTKSLV